MQNGGRLEPMATLKLPNNAELYLLVDFLNRTLKTHNLMFGLAKKDEEMIFSVYEV